MASSDLLFPIFWISWNLSSLHTNSFLTGGQLGQTLWKIVPFFREESFFIWIQNLTLIAVDRFGAVVFPLRSPLIRPKLCPFFILAAWIVAVTVSLPDVFTYELIENPEGARLCVSKRKKVFRGSSSRASFILAICILFVYIPVLLLVILYSIILIKLKTQVHPGEQSANTQQQWQRRNRKVSASNVHRYRNSVCAFLVTLLYQRFNHTVSCQFYAFLVQFRAIL